MSEAPIVLRVDEQHHYEVLVDGEHAGFTAYRDRGEQRVFIHTKIDEAYAGRGLAARLVEEALIDVRESGMRIVAVCPYTAKFLKRHEEFADIVDPATPEILHWLDTETT